MIGIRHDDALIQPGALGQPAPALEHRSGEGQAGLLSAVAAVGLLQQLKNLKRISRLRHTWHPCDFFSRSAVMGLKLVIVVYGFFSAYSVKYQT
jgi:hypothetical protein